MFHTFCTLKRHRRADCDAVKHVYPGGVYTPSPNIFELLAGCGVSIHPSIPRFYPHFMIFDLEALQTFGSLPLDTTSISYETHHQLCSGAVVANFPPYTVSKVFMIRKDFGSEQVAMALLEYMIEISDESYR